MNLIPVLSSVDSTRESLVPSLNDLYKSLIQLINFDISLNRDDCCLIKLTVLPCGTC